MTTIKIAPSILSADFARLGEEVKAVISAGADAIHIDVMDNHYVPNLTIGPLVCKSLRNYGIDAFFDVHLMIKPVDQIIPAFASAGANLISFHPEASDHVDRTINLIKSYGCLAGLAFNPATPLDYLDYTIDLVDMILIMTVNPGFGGQEFIEGMLTKIKHVKDRIKNSCEKSEKSKKIMLAVDGGICTQTIAPAAQAGADFFVAGSAIFKKQDYSDSIFKLRKTANENYSGL